MAIERGVTEGFGGKGISYVTAGASWVWDADANLDEYGNHYGVITVCAVNHQDIQPVFLGTGRQPLVMRPRGRCIQRAGDHDNRSRQLHGILQRHPGGGAHRVRRGRTDAVRQHESDLAGRETDPRRIRAPERQLEQRLGAGRTAVRLRQRTTTRSITTTASAWSTPGRPWLSRSAWTHLARAAGTHPGVPGRAGQYPGRSRQRLRRDRHDQHRRRYRLRGVHRIRGDQPRH